jgi:hypothetical protein
MHCIHIPTLDDQTATGLSRAVRAASDADISLIHNRVLCMCSGLVKSAVAAFRSGCLGPSLWTSLVSVTLKVSYACLHATCALSCVNSRPPCYFTLALQSKALTTFCASKSQRFHPSRCPPTPALEPIVSMEARVWFNGDAQSALVPLATLETDAN